MQPEPALFWTVLAGCGLAIAVVGWFDLALLWYPLRFGDAEWEFGTISAHLNGLPLGTLGLALVAAAALAGGKRRTARALAVLCLLIVVSLLAAGLIYLLDVPVVWRAANSPAIQHVVKKAMLKAGIFAATYFVFYAWLALILWRGSRVTRDPA